MMSTEALIRDLSANVAPVRRRSIGRDAMILLALAALELTLLMGGGLMRPDFGRVIGMPFMLWKMASLALLAGASCAVALQSFAPPSRPRQGTQAVLTLAALAILCGAFVAPSAEASKSLLDRLAPLHGLLCAASIVTLSLPLMAVLAVLMRRAAPASPRSSAWVAGIAAATTGSLIFTVCCPMNDPLYIVVWYSAAVAMVSVVARTLLPRRFHL